MNNQKVNTALRQLAGMAPPAPVVDPTAAPKIANAHAGNGYGQTGAAAPRGGAAMNRLLRASAYGRRQTEFITVTGETK